MAFFSATKVIIENSEGEILMVQEAKDHVHKSWDFPGGGFEKDETVIECAEREVLEETGYSAEMKQVLGIYKGDSNKSRNETIVFVFTGEIGEKKTEQLEDDIIDVRFFKPEEIKELDLREKNRIDILKKYQEGERYPLDILWDELELFN